MSIAWHEVSIPKRINRTVLELATGVLVIGILAQGIGAFVAEDGARYAKSLWFGILLALANSWHMYRTLDRALDRGEKAASKMIFRGYLFRYAMMIAFLAVIMITEVMNPLVVFFAYLSLKVSAFLQPLTHRFYLFLFHETDPVPRSLEEIEAEEAARHAEETVECADETAERAGETVECADETAERTGEVSEHADVTDSTQEESAAVDGELPESHED